MRGDPEDLEALIAGSKSAWDRFVVQFTGLVVSAARRTTGERADVEDIVQEVFLRLCKDDYRLMRQYDPARASLSTWLTIITRSMAHDILRRRHAETQPLEGVAEAALAVEPVEPERVKLPPGLLSPRQELIINLLYRQELEVSEVAAMLKVDPQTVRSTHHKAMLKLRAYFAS